MKSYSNLIRRVGKAVNEPHLLQDIQNACRNKQAFCFGDDSTRVVLKKQKRDGVTYILVWLGISSGAGALEKFNPIVSEFTRQAGGKWFEFCTVRRGFIRVAGKLGFERMPDDEQGRMWFRRMV